MSGVGKYGEPEEATFLCLWECKSAKHFGELQHYLTMWKRCIILWPSNSSPSYILQGTCASMYQDTVTAETLLAKAVNCKQPKKPSITEWINWGVLIYTMKQTTRAICKMHKSSNNFEREANYNIMYPLWASLSQVHKHTNLNHGD